VSAPDANPETSPEAARDPSPDASRNPSAPAGNAARPAVDRTIAAYEAFQQRLMAAHVDEFTTLDLTMSQAKLLYVVMASGELTLSEIASQLRVTASTASGAVDHLVGLGFISRTDDPTNRRQLRVSVTPLGTQTIERLRELSTRQMRAFFEVISDEDLAVVERSIQILSDAVTTSAGAIATTGSPE
jgi:DNA-binding MarR family transcriptional regulator